LTDHLTAGSSLDDDHLEQMIDLAAMELSGVGWWG
jgi:hypothetical protein